MTQSSPQFVLASQSPRRKQILFDLGYEFEVRPTSFNERSISEDQTPSAYALATAIGKAQTALTHSSENEIILASDLIVWANSTFLHKPATLSDAATMIRELCDKWHIEHGACVVGTARDGIKTRSDETRVWIPALTESQLELYLQQADPTDKAGGFDIRCYASLVGAHTIKYEGAMTTIIGLNATAAAELLTQFGLPPARSPAEVEDKYKKELFEK